MKKSMLLAFVAALAIPSSAFALAQVPRQVCVGPGLLPAGIATPLFTFNGNGPAGECLYQMDWQSPLGPYGVSVLCDIFEQKAIGHTSCLYNSFSDFATIVQSKPGCCQGYDYFGIPQDVVLSMGESPLPATSLSGIAVYKNWPVPQQIVFKL